MQSWQSMVLHRRFRLEVSHVSWPQDNRRSQRAGFSGDRSALITLRMMLVTVCPSPPTPGNAPPLAGP
jgi:hypothetical protein